MALILRVLGGDFLVHHLPAEHSLALESSSRSMSAISGPVGRFPAAVSACT